MKIAAAQISATVGAIEDNLTSHYQMIAKAAEHKTDLIVFPEMSISGYCRKEGRSLAFGIDDERLSPLQQLADKHTISIIAGAPIAMEDKLYIGSFVLQAHAPLQIYTKQYLHQGEDDFYDASFAYEPVLQLKGESIGLAICADIDNPAHPAKAQEKGVSLYLASIFFSEGGIAGGHQMLSQYAQKHQFNVLMSNYCGAHWQAQSGGKSAFWDAEGNLISALGPQHPGLLIVEKQAQSWKQIYSSDLAYT